MGEFTPILISHGKFPNHYGFMYGVKLQAPPATFHAAMDATLGQRGRILKAFFPSQQDVDILKALPKDGDWITIHPNGEAHDGVPVFITPNGDGSHTIVAGAGGKLNGFKLSKVKEKGQYAQESAEKHKAARETAKQAQIEKVSQMGQQAYEEMGQHLEASKSRRDSEKIASGREFARQVLSAQGINPAQVLDVPDEVFAGADPARKTQIEKAHVKGLVSYAKSVTKDLRDRIITALESASPEVSDASFGDLVRETLFPKNPGYSINAAQMAVDRGMMPSKAALESLADDSRLLRHGDVESAARAKAYQQKLQAGAERAREEIKAALQRAGSLGSGPLAAFGDSAKPIDLQDAVKLLSMEKGLRELDRSHKEEKVAEMGGDLSGTTRPIADPHSPMVVSPAHESEAVEDILRDSQAASMVRFLTTAKDMEDASGSLYGSFTRGRFETLISSVSSILPGIRLDPALVDTLGSEGSARLLTATLRSASGEGSFGAFVEGIKKVHTSTQKKLVDDAVEYAKPLVEAASADVKVDPSSPTSVIAAYAQTERNRSLLKVARERLGYTKGVIEARASLNMALSQKPGLPIESILPMDLTTAAIHCAGVLGSYGLNQGSDYTLLSGKSGETLLSITPEATARLRPAISPELAKRQQAITAPTIPTTHPVGFRREIGAKSPLREIATKGVGDLSPRDVSIMRRWWADATGLGGDDEPAHPLGTKERVAWDNWQKLATSGKGYKAFPGVREAQAALEDRLPELSTLDLENTGAVLDFAARHSFALGYDGAGDHIIGLSDVPETKAFKTAQHRVARLIRSIYSDAQGAEHFDPEEVPSVSKAWTNFIRQNGSFGKAVQVVQEGMLSDPNVKHGGGKAFNLTPIQQQARGLIGRTQRIAAALSAGAGKTSVLYSTFTDARKLYNDSGGTQGAKRALMLVPSAVQGQFGSEWSKFMDPSTDVTIHAKPGASKAERERALASADIMVMTPESWRDTLVSGIASRQGMTPEAAASHLRTASEPELDRLVHSLMADKNWGTGGYFAHDESHRLLEMEGSEQSLMGKLADSSARYRGHPEDPDTQTKPFPYYISSTADPVKHSSADAWSLLHKVAPSEYPPESKDAFLRRYRTDEKGNLSESAGLALRMEMMPYVFTAKANLDTDTLREDVVIPLSPPEQARHDEVYSAYRSAKSAKAAGRTDTAAEQVLGTNDPRLYALARDRIISDAVNLDPQGGRATYLSQQLRQDPQPTIVFATSLAAIKMLSAKLAAEGHKVRSLTGKDSGLQKDRIAKSFTAGDFDILIASDAAEAGMNLQRATRVMNYNCPYTAKGLEQRIARSWRIGQTKDVTVKNLVSDCEWDHKNLARVKRKGGLREVMTTPLYLADDDGHQFWKFAEEAAKGGVGGTS